MTRRLPIFLSLALVAAYLAPGAIVEALVHAQGATLPAAALFVVYLTGAVLIVFPIASVLVPHLLTCCRVERAAEMVRKAAIHALHLVLAFLPPWQIASYFGAHAAPRVLLTAGGAALLLLLLDPIFRSLGYGFFDE
jgi:hypothetical protein